MFQCHIKFIPAGYNGYTERHMCHSIFITYPGQWGGLTFSGRKLVGHNFYLLYVCFVWLFDLNQMTKMNDPKPWFRNILPCNERYLNYELA